MINPRIGPASKLLVIYDQPQSAEWGKVGKVNIAGIGQLVKEGVLGHGISLDEVSVCCLSDVVDGKSQDFKAKEEQIEDIIETYAPNLLLLATAKAFEKCMGMKGASKFYNKPLWCARYSTKAITLPPYSMLAFKPNVASTIEAGWLVVKKEMESPALVEKEAPTKDYHLITNMNQFEEFYEHFHKNVFRFALDIETDSLQFNVGTILTIQFSEKYNSGYCIPTPDYHGTWTPSEWEYVTKKLNALIEDDRREKIGANIYFDLKHLNHKYGTKLVHNNVTDILIASFLVDENRESHSLKFCAATLLDNVGDYDRPLEEYKDTYCKKNKLKKTDFKYSYVPLEILFPYSCMDVDYSLQLADYFAVQLKLEGQEQVFKDVSSYSWALARIERSGWKVDLSEAYRYRYELTERIDRLFDTLNTLPEIEKAVKSLSRLKLEKENALRKSKLSELKEPLSFLVNSAAHKRYLFKEVLRLPEIKKTRSGSYSTDKDCFKVWTAQYPEVESLKVIKEIEELKKMLSTYVNAIITRNVNGRIHCSFRVTGAATGRISCTQPNMQNIAMHSDEAKKLKKCFIAEEGHSLVVADLSNAELRITAALSNDPVMVNGFIQGLDPHSNTAKEVFELDCPVSEVKEKHNDLRQAAKTLGFAALYGAGPSVIAKNASISTARAKEMLEEYFNKYKGVKAMLDANIRSTRETGYSVSVLGRRRRVPQINSEDQEIRSKAERQANNFIVQSVASDGMLQSIVNMWHEIDDKQLPYKIINVIHDSCEMEVPDEMVTEAHEFIIRHLSRFPRGVEAAFPMKADAEVGKSWADLKEYEEDMDYAEMVFSGSYDEEEMEEAA